MQVAFETGDGVYASAEWDVFPQDVRPYEYVWLNGQLHRIQVVIALWVEEAGWPRFWLSLGKIKPFGVAEALSQVESCYE